MLDILPGQLSDDDKNNQSVRNQVAKNALDKAIKSKPAPLYDKKYVNRITVGNFEDDFYRINEADWIIEVVVERLDIKRQILEKVDEFRSPGSIVSSNTSSIPIKLLAEGRTEDFKKYFCGTHFFNPPRYLRLLEIIPTQDSLAELVQFFMHYGEINLGKQTVLCKDTPAFIANRIGVMSGAKVFQLTEKFDLTIEEVDLLTGPILGRPKTGSFRLQDLVGIDTGDKVTKFVVQNVKYIFFEKLNKDKTHIFFNFLLENNFFFYISGKWFYQKTKQKDENGRTIINAIDLKTLEYRKSVRPKISLIKEAKGIEKIDKRFQLLISKDEKESLFIKEYFAALLSYSASGFRNIR